MRVVGFVGPSGTGKSHRSSWVAREKNINFIIDDGLLIFGSRIVAGKSAKREPTKIGSVKCALFTEESHRIDVSTAIERYKPDGIMIIGTSDSMVASIAKRLEIGSVNETIYITEVASADEMQQALRSRKFEGKHVIPVPTLEIKKDFSGFFLDPLQIFRKRDQEIYQLIGEKSVVRPTFSYMGRYTISDYAIFQLVEFAALSQKGVHKITRFRVNPLPEGIYLDVDLTLIYGYVLKPLLLNVQKSIRYEVERLTALNIISLNVTAKSLIMPGAKQTSI